MKRAPWIAALTIAGVMQAGMTHAACPQELAIYSELGGSAQIEFSAEPAGFIVTNSFRLLLTGDLSLDGMVIWNQGLSRPNGIISHQCPDGDVTGEELEACTYWEGVVYTIASDGSVDFIGQDDAAEKLLFPDLSRQLHYSDLKRDDGLLMGFDVFALSGCQE